MLKHVGKMNNFLLQEAILITWNHFYIVSADKQKMNCFSWTA